MQAQWFLSQFYTDSILGIDTPICTAYGGQYLCPLHPASGGWALVQMLSTSMQMDAARSDPRVLVLPYLFDPTPVAAAVITAYASMGATAGMSLGLLLATLAATEPLYGAQL